MMNLIIVPLIAFALLFILVLFILWVWAMVDCLSSKLTKAEKLFWVIVLLLFNLLGAILYMIFSRIGGKRIVKSKNLKGKKLFRSRKDRIIAGVCSGIAKYLELDPTVIRLIWAFLTLASFGTGIIAYIIAMIIIPEER